MNRTALILMFSLSKITFRKFYLALPCFMLMACYTGLEKQSNIEPVPERRGGSRGYLPMESLPNSLVLLPPPPSENSAAFALDVEINRKSLTLRGTPRWDLANEDGATWFPETVEAFSCSLNAPITEKDTPHLYSLLSRTYEDVGFSDTRAKYRYQRPEPYFVNKEPTCTSRRMKDNNSYPSGTAAVGWAWALILSEIAPEKSDSILVRGYAFGQSRVICNTSWQSDVDAGRLLGAAVVARLHTEPEFLAAIEAAKAKLVAVRAKGLLPQRDCEAEAAALSNAQ